MLPDQKAHMLEILVSRDLSFKRLSGGFLSKCLNFNLHVRHILIFLIQNLLKFVLKYSFFLWSIESKYLLLRTLCLKTLRVIFYIYIIFVQTLITKLTESTPKCACLENVAKSKLSTSNLRALWSPHPPGHHSHMYIQMFLVVINILVSNKKITYLNYHK